MPFLAGGYHLPFPQKVALTNASFIAMMWELTDDYESSGDWVEYWQDAGAILQFGTTLYVLWIPPVVQAGIAARVGVLLAPLAVPAAIATSAIIAGGVVSYAIDPKEGLDNYKDFISEPTKIPGRLKFTGETIYEHKVEPAVNVTLGIASMLWNIGIREVERKRNEIETGMDEIAAWIEDNQRFLTGPYLPF